MTTGVQAGDSLVITPVSVAEIYAGSRPYELLRTTALLAELECIPMSRNIGMRAGSLLKLWRSKGRTLTLADMTIAATAIEHDLVLFTLNQKDFPMRELRLHPLPGEA